MFRIFNAVVGLAAALMLLAAATASAHQGDPNYRSVVRSTTPASADLGIEVLGSDDELQLTNDSGKTVVIYGYNREPYARLLADGTVQVNQRSPARYLNEDRWGDVDVPKSANARSSPLWETQDHAGRFTWHDHRMHWMSHSLPPAVKDKSVKTKIFDYRVPLRVGGQPGAISGTLYWVGSDSGFPVAAIVALAVIVALALGTVVLVRRRRRTAAAATVGGPPAAAASGDPAPADRPARDGDADADQEAW